MARNWGLVDKIVVPVLEMMNIMQLYRGEGCYLMLRLWMSDDVRVDVARQG